MPMTIPLLLTDILALLAAYLLYRFILRRYSGKFPYPPGPKPHFLLGNIRDVPEQRPWLAYMKMSQELDSPMIHLDMLGTHFVVINDYATAQEIFDKRFARYSDRPRMVMINEVAGWSWNFAFGRYNERWKICRRLFDSQFREAEARKLRPREERSVRSLLQRLLQTPEDFIQHFHFYGTALILDLGYGIDVQRSDDPYVQVADLANDTVNRSLEGQICEVFPWAQHLPSWLPGMHWKKQTTHWKKYTSDLVNVPFEVVKSGTTTKSSIASRLCEEAETNGDSKATVEIIKGTVGTMFGAGTDTTASALQCILMVALVFPAVQLKAQEELDRVVGHDRLPDFKDMPRLPYIQAFTKELLRWTCLVPLALPHVASEDDVWVGRDGKPYFIPKGAVIFGNAWAMSRNPSIYPDPDNFIPSRFLTKDGMSLDPKVQNPEFVFGFRARTCPGRWLAEDEIFIMIATILAIFAISPASDKDTWENDFNTLMVPDLMLHPQHFRCKITPRHERVAVLVRDADIDF